MKRFATWLLALLCVAVGVAYWIDLNNYMDLKTGLVQQGSIWLRYGIVGGAVVLCALAALLYPKRPVAFEHRSVLWGLGSLLCGAGIAMLCGFQLLRYQTLAIWQLVEYGLFILTALWLLLLGFSRFARTAVRPSGSVWPGILGTLSFFMLTITRFILRPAAVYRLIPSLSVLSALAALVFTTVLVRAAYLPRSGHGGGKRIALWGMVAFLLCFCVELPQTVSLYMQGICTVADLAETCVVALVGLFGLVSAMCCLRAPVLEAAYEAPVTEN